MNTKINISDFLNPDLHLIIAQRNAMDDCRPLINSSKSNDSGMIVIDIYPKFVWVTRFWVLPWGINTTFLYIDTSSRRTNLSLRRLCESLWLHLILHLLKDIINGWVTFCVIDSSSLSLIFCVSYSRSSAAMEEEVREALEAGSSSKDKTWVLWSPNGNS